MSSSAKRKASEPENFRLLPSCDSEFQSQFTTEFSHPSKSDQHQNPPPYTANMPESTENDIAGPTTQSPLEPTLTMNTVAFQDVLGNNAKLKEENTRLREENTRLREDTSRLREDTSRLRAENTRTQGRLNDSEGGQKRLLILFVFLLVFLLLGYTFASPIINAWFKSNENAKTAN
ncbi:unnamed protein product [Sphagnum compactum]